MDPAVELAALLPAEVERCVVSRPALVAERRRSLVLLHSRAEPSAWEPELGVVAYASALAEAQGGRQARRSYFRFASPSTERVERLLRVRWLDEPCEGEACRRPVARWIDGQTLEVARYEWPRRRLPVSSGGCVQLARERPDAVEVATRVAESVGTVHLLRPARERSAMSVRGSSLLSERELTFDDPVEARILESQVEQGGTTDVALVPMRPSLRQIEREGERVTVREARRWDELELALEDDRLRRQAMALRVARREPLPVERVRVHELASVRHQIGLRRAELARLGPEARAVKAAELRELLRRAWAAHPSELSLAMSLARLALDVLDDPPQALAVADDVLTRGIAEPRAWRTVRREAYSRMGAEPLAQALSADAIATGDDARRAAHDLVALAGLGVPYEWAEGAWRTSRQLGWGSAPRRRAEAFVPFEGMLGALVGWARLQGDLDHVTVQIAVHSRAPGEVRAIGEARPEVVAVRASDGGMVYVGALASPDLAELRRLGAALGAAIPSSSLEMIIELRDPSGAHASTLRASGTLASDTFHLERVGAELADVSWPLLTRYLARPLAELETSLFPPPTLVVRAESPELAAALRASVEPSHPGACSVAGPIVRCRLPGRPEALGTLLLQLAAERMTD